VLFNNTKWLFLLDSQFTTSRPMSVAV